MMPRLASSRRVRSEPLREAEETTEPPRPLLRPAPRSAMFFPLVMVAAILPGLYALNWWDLSPPGPWWGLRALAILDGRWIDQTPTHELGPAAESKTFRAVALQPPLYSWLEAVGLRLCSDRDPLATVLPSYAAGVLVVVLVYLHGRLWHGRGLGLTAALLTALHRDLLAQMQQASPATLGILGMLGAILCYIQVARSEGCREVGWSLLGGLALGLSLLSVGLLGLVCIPVLFLHAALLARRGGTTWRTSRWSRWRLSESGVRASVAISVVGILLALPWHLAMARWYGVELFDALLHPPGPAELVRQAIIPVALLRLAPVTLPLGLLGAVRAYRHVRDRDEGVKNDGESLWLIWIAAATLLLACWPAGPRPAQNLFLLIPLNLFSAQAMTDLASRKIPARALTWLAPATACTVAWWFSSDLRGALDHLAHGRSLSSSTMLGLNLGVGLVASLAILTRVVDRWARTDDDRRRRLLGVFLGAVLAVTAGTGLREVRFRHRETAELLELRDVVLRRHRAQPFQLVAVVGPGSASNESPGLPPGGRLRFVLRSALPKLGQIDLCRTEDLLSLPRSQRLIILAGTEERLPYAVQSRLGLEVIHPGRTGVLDAYATSYAPSRRVRR